MSWLDIIHLGDLRLQLALACAIAAWLCAGRAWRAAAWWVTLVFTGFGLVAAAKIGYLGWGVQLRAVNYKAASGHAAAATAVWPMFFCLVLRPWGKRYAVMGLGAGLALGAVVAAALVVGGEHAVSEALAGWGIGALVSAAAWITLRDTSTETGSRAVVMAVTVLLVTAWCLRAVPVGWWMIKTALVLSGELRPHQWNDC